MAEMKCPKCGNSGEADADPAVAFEVRGQFEGSPVRKCVRCGAGIVVGRGFLGGPKPRLIPAEIWKRMEDMWEQEFGTK